MGAFHFVKEIGNYNREVRQKNKEAEAANELATDPRNSLWEEKEGFDAPKGPFVLRASFFRSFP